jgi:hypothetical protein
MSVQLFVVVLLAIVLAVYVATAIRTWIRFRGVRVVTCPECRRPAAVTVDVGRAMVSAVRERADVRIDACSRWPERRGCGETCVPQIEASTEETRAKTIAARFFKDRRCVICGRRIGPLKPGPLQPGFMNSITREAVPWFDVPAQDLSDAILERRPLCADCTLAESSRHPWPVTYRQAWRGRMPRQ